MISSGNPVIRSGEENFFFVDILKTTKEETRIGTVSVNQWYGSADPDPCQIATNPEHRLYYICLSFAGNGSNKD
jgi:hypothetical protein